MITLEGLFCTIYVVPLDVVVALEITHMQLRTIQKTCWSCLNVDTLGGYGVTWHDGSVIDDMFW